MRVDIRAVMHIRAGACIDLGGRRLFLGALG
jgi:hypothetical protein